MPPPCVGLMSKFALLFLIVFFGGIIAAVAYTPVAAFVLYQLVYFLNPESRWWGASIPDLRYSLITVLFMMLMLALRYKNLNSYSSLREQPAVKWLLAILLMYYVVYFFALIPQLHWRFTFDFTKLILILFIAYKLLITPAALTAALWAYIVGAAYIGYVATVTGRNGFGRVENIGMVDTGSDSNMTAAALVPPIILLMYYAWLGSWKVRLLCVVFGAYIVNGLVLINSRGAFLGAIAGAAVFILYMLFSAQQRKGQRLVALLIVISGLAGFVRLADDTFWLRMQTLKQVEDQDASGSHRVEFWLATFDMMEDYPKGTGVGGYILLSPNYLPEHYFERRTIGKAVHSSWFQALSEVGWPGPILFACLLVCLYRQSRDTKKFVLQQGESDIYFKILALEAGFVGYLISASFIDRFRAEVLYWMVLFLIVAANVYYLQYKHGVKVTTIESGSDTDKGNHAR